MKAEQAIEAIRAGHTITVPYHVEGYGPGRTCHSWGALTNGEAAGPEGWLRVGVDNTGSFIIDEWDDEVCPSELHGVPVSNGMVIVST